eukprot:5448884-Pyramimonas_sp.AAC.1
MLRRSKNGFASAPSTQRSPSSIRVALGPKIEIQQERGHVGSSSSSLAAGRRSVLSTMSEIEYGPEHRMSPSTS